MERVGSSLKSGSCFLSGDLVPDVETGVFSAGCFFRVFFAAIMGKCAIYTPKLYDSIVSGGISLSVRSVNVEGHGFDFLFTDKYTLVESKSSENFV